MAPARSFIPSPSTFYTPSIPLPSIDVDPASPRLFGFRLARLVWIAVTLPLHLTFVLITTLIPRFPLPIHIPGRHRRWTLAQRAAYPLVSRVIWAIAGTGGGPADISEEAERLVPISSRAVEWVGGLFGGRKVRIWVEDVATMPRERAQEWLKGEALDPRGEVQPVKVPCFWLERAEDGDGRRRRAREGERVVLYLVGGGYISGSPAEANRCFELARNSGVRIMGANYRKATSDLRAHPAALQDAILAYSHLVIELGYTDIVLAGDSAGGGLATSLLLYLSTTLADSMASLVLPSRMLLYSPWCDLTLSAYRSGLAPQFADDLLNPTMLNYAADAYLANTFPRPSDTLLLAKSHPFTLGAHHPFFSPALRSSLPILRTMAARCPSIKFYIISGSAEIFAPEIGAFAKNLEDVCVRVRWHEEVDEVHGFMMVPAWVSPAAGRMMGSVTEFLLAA